MRVSGPERRGVGVAGSEAAGGLVQGAGNLGSPAGDVPARPEFTECRLSPYGDWLACTMVDQIE